MTAVSLKADARAILQDLTDIVGTHNVTAAACDLICYDKDFSLTSTSTRFRPDFVTQPETTEQVSAIVQVAIEHKIPVLPRGGGTGMWGGAIPTNGGIVLEMRKMNRVVDVDEEKRTVTVQSGAVIRDLASYLEGRGFFVADKPESWFAATVGARSQVAGTGFLYNSRYGRSTDQVLSLEVVLPTGEVIRTGASKVHDSASGYDLTRLFSSAEGTLGIVTEVTLRTYRLPEHRVISIFVFPAYEDAMDTVGALRDSGLVPETIETMDGVSYYGHVAHERGQTAPNEQVPGTAGAMVIGYAGVGPLVEAQLELTRAICARHGGERAPDLYVENWAALKETYPVNPFALHAAARMKSIKYVLDATVPLESTADLVRSYHSLAEEYGVESCGIVASHCAPDFHSAVYARAYVDERNESEITAVRRMEGETYERVMHFGGGIGGAGGVGMIRVPYAEEAYASAWDLIGRLKQLLDPHSIMNPGKKVREV